MDTRETKRRESSRTSKLRCAPKKIETEIFMYGTKLIKSLLAVTLFIGMCACSSTPKIQEYATTSNAADELQRFATDMNFARDAQVEVLSPSAYQSADRALKSATVNQQNGKDSKDVLHEVAKGRAQLERANKFAELS